MVNDCVSFSADACVFANVAQPSADHQIPLGMLIYSLSQYDPVCFLLAYFDQEKTCSIEARNLILEINHASVIDHVERVAGFFDPNVELVWFVKKTDLVETKTETRKCSSNSGENACPRRLPTNPSNPSGRCQKTEIVDHGLDTCQSWRTAAAGVCCEN